MNLFEKLIAYLRGTREEVRKVSWPSRQDTIRYSALVLGASIVVAVFFATLDFGFTKLVDVALTERNASGVTAKTTPPPTNANQEIEKSLVPTPSSTAPKFDLQGIETATGSGAGLKVTPIDTAPIQPQK